MRSVLRALLTAHLQASKNRFVRQLGSSGVALVLVALLMITLGMILPIVLGLSGGAYFLARAAFGPNGSPALGSVLGLVLTGIALVGGVIGGVAGGAKQLEWEQYRQYPVRPATLFGAEVIAGLGDGITIVQSMALVGICLATTLAAPHLWWAMAVLAVQSVLLLLCVQLLIGSVAERLVKRMRLLLAATVGLAFVLSQLAMTRVKGGFEIAGLRAAGDAVLELASYLPASQAMRGAHLGQWYGLLSAVMATVAVVLLAYLVLVRERDAAVVEAAGSPERLWSHPTPMLTVARLQVDTLLGSHLGKFAFAMPLITLVLIRGPLADLAGTQRWLVPGAFIYISLAANGLGFNQFGLDGHGVKALLLLPIGERVILEGKQLGFAVWQGLQAALLAVLLVIVQAPKLDELLAGVMLFICYFFAQGVVGQRTSVWLPRRMQRTSMKNAQIPLPVVLISFATTLVSGLLFGGAFGALLSFARPLLLPGMTLVALVTFLVSRPLLRLNAGFLARHRERLLDALG